MKNFGGEKTEKVSVSHLFWDLQVLLSGRQTLGPGGGLVGSLLDGGFLFEVIKIHKLRISALNFVVLTELTFVIYHLKIPVFILNLFAAVFFSI